MDILAKEGTGCNKKFGFSIHKLLTEIINEKELLDELICPDWLKEIDLKGFKYLAYPFWRYNDNIIDIIQKYYIGARSGNGFSNNTQYAMDSIKVTSKTNIWRL